MEELLADYAADVATMHGAADQVSSNAGGAEHVSSAVSAQHAPAQAAVAGSLVQPMRAAPAPVARSATSVAQNGMWFRGVVQVFVDGVSAYNEGVAALREYWTRVALHDFGQSGGTDEERFEARQPAQAWVVQRRQALEDDLNAVADEVVTMLGEGVTDDTLVRLWNRGALPMGAEATFPDSAFMSQVDPHERWAVVSAEYFPHGVTREAVDNVQLDHESVAELSVLLDIEPTTEEEQRLLYLLGAYASDTAVDAATRGEPGRETLDILEMSTVQLRRINERAADRTLTRGEASYLEGWLGAGESWRSGLFEDLPAAVNEAVHQEMLGVPHAEEDSYFQRMRSRYLSPIADAIMNLSTTADGPGIDEDAPIFINAPDSDMQIGLPPGPGLTPEETGYPDWLPNHEVNMTTVFVLGPPLEHGDNVTSTVEHMEAWQSDPGVWVPGLDRVAGFADVMGTATFRGGDEFMTELGDLADGLEGQLETTEGSLHESLEVSFIGLLGHDGEYMGMSPDELADHYASNDELVGKIEDQLDPLLNRGHRAVNTIRDVVERHD